MAGTRAAKQQRTLAPAAPLEAMRSRPPGSPAASRLLQLQSAAGNRAVQRLVGSAGKGAQPVQREIGKVDEFLLNQQVERATELDRISSQMNVSSVAPAIRSRRAAITTPPAPEGRVRAAAVSGAAPGPSAPPARFGSTIPKSMPSPAELRERRVQNGGNASPTPLELPAAFHGEDTRSIATHEPGDLTKYLTPAERAANTLTPGTDAPGGEKTLRTPGGAKVRNFAKNPHDEDAAVYAMSPTGQIVASSGTTALESDLSGPNAKWLHHSSMFGRTDVAHAGHIGAGADPMYDPNLKSEIAKDAAAETTARTAGQVKEADVLKNRAAANAKRVAGNDAHAGGGKVNYLDDDSGHFKPGQENTFEAFTRMAESGVLNPNSATDRVGMVNKTQAAHKGDPAYDASLLTPNFSAYQQAGGNEALMRQKAGMLAELDEKMKRAGK